MSLIGYYMVSHEKKLLYTEALQTGVILAESLSIPIANDIIYEKLGLIEEGGLIDNYLSEIALKKELTLKYIMIVDNDNKIISHNDISECGKTYNDPVSKAAVNASNTMVQTYSYNQEEILDISTPLIITGKKIATLRIGLSLEKIRIAKKKTINKVILTTGVLLLISFIGILNMSKRFIKPIEELAYAFEQAGKGDLDTKVQINSTDEFGSLGQNFNDMIQKIKLSQEQLKQTQAKLIQSEKMISMGILSSGLAHEINNPLGGVLNCLYMIEKNINEPHIQKKYISLAQEGLDKIKNTISRLLSFGKISDKVERFNINDSINNVIELLSYKINKANIQMMLSLQNDLPFVEIEPQAFHQVIFNIILNAIQAMPNGGKLIIKSFQEDNYVLLSVADNGIGIAKENLKRIFDPFFTTKQAQDGTGLGLWICYHVIKEFNGDILVESKENEGSCFTIKLPIGNK